MVSCRDVGDPLVFPIDQDIAILSHAPARNTGLHVSADRDEMDDDAILETLRNAPEKDILAGRDQMLNAGCMNACGKECDTSGSKYGSHCQYRLLHRCHTPGIGMKKEEIYQDCQYFRTCRGFAVGRTPFNTQYGYLKGE